MTGRSGSSADPVRAVTFDLWGTLLELAPGDAEKYEEARERVWLQEASTWPSIPGTPPPVTSEEEARAQVITETRRDASEGRSKSIELQGHRMAELLGREYRAGGIARQLDPIIRHLPVRIAPGARSTLSELERWGLKLGIISNLLFEPAASVRGLLAERHLLRYFHHLTLSEELPWCKPSPLIFRSCLEELGAIPREAVHVGDAPEDVVGATRAGYRGIYLLRAKAVTSAGPARPARAGRGPVLRPLARLSELLDAGRSDGFFRDLSPRRPGSSGGARA
jgi:FMN phosphatase YigB (HAD superfamily)